jgi:transposase-like protein
MNTCPYCQATQGQVKNGFNRSGTQRWLCRTCQRVYTPQPKTNGYDDAIRLEAVRLYLDGMNLRRIARTLQVNHQSVANWVKAYAARLPDAPVPTQVEVVELDELFTFVEKKSQLT